jgi:hypothetical protein
MEGAVKADHANGFDHGLDVGDDVHGLLAYARGVSDPALGVDAVAQAIVTVIQAERRFARLCYTLLVTGGVANAVFCAFAAAWILQVPLVEAIFIGICAGMGASSTGLILIPWDAIAQRLRDFIRRWRRA